MKVEISYLALKSAVKMLSMFVSNAEKDEYKMLSLYYNSTSGKLEIKAGSNIGIGRVCVTTAKGDTDSNVYVVMAEQFFDIVKGIYSDVTISAGKDKDVMNIKFGKSNYKIPVLPDEIVADFVSLFDNEVKLNFKPAIILDAERMKHKIKCISHCISNDDALVELSAICINGNNLLATDSVVGGITKYDGLNTVSGNLISKFPISFIDSLSVDKIGIKYSADGMLVSAERPEYGVSAMFAAQANHFPIESISRIVSDYDGADDINGHLAISAVFSPTALADAIGRLCVLTDDNAQGIDITFSPDESDFCELTINNHNFEGYESVHVVYNVKPEGKYSVRVDGKQLLKSLKVMNGDCYFSASSADDVQFLSDVDTTIFFYGLQ